MKLGNWVYTATFVLVFVAPGTESIPGLRSSLRERTKDFFNVAQATETEGAALLASTPPLGWNSWDGYGTTVNEKQVKSNAKWISQNLKQFGWQYVVVDMEWFVTKIPFRKEIPNLSTTQSTPTAGTFLRQTDFLRLWEVRVSNPSLTTYIR